MNINCLDVKVFILWRISRSAEGRLRHFTKASTFGAARVIAPILQEFITLGSRDDIDLCIHPFAHGLLYTALSHVRHRADTLALFSESKEELTTGAKVVYQKLLLWIFPSNHYIQFARPKRSPRKMYLCASSPYSFVGSLVLVVTLKS